MSVDATSADGLSIVKGPPLSEEPGLGTLTLPGFLREVTERYAGREALVMHTPGGVVRWSYKDLWDRSVEVARALIACGVGKDSRVGVLMTNRPEWIAAAFGVNLAGGVFVSLSTFSTQPELEYLLQASGISTLLLERNVGKRDFTGVLCDLEPDLLKAKPGKLASNKFPFLRRVAVVDDPAPSGAMESWSAFLAHGASIAPGLVDEIAASVKPSDTAALFFSSGSTAKPKGIFSAHRGIATQCWRMKRLYALGEDTRCWMANAFFWSGNFATAMGATLAAGGSLILQGMFNPVEALELMQKERVTYPVAWPHQWAQLAGAPNWNDVDLSSLRYVDPSCALTKHPTVRPPEWREPKWTYGNTETFTFATSYPCDTPPQITGDSHGEALPGNTVKIVDPATGAILPRGERGEIAVKGPTLMLGYLGKTPDETFDQDGFFATGDGGYIDDKNRLVWEGRLNDIIKTGGANVSPLEIDAALVPYPGVKAAKTVGVPHETLGEMVVACIVPHEGATLSEDGVREFLKAHLASYKVPRRVLFFEEKDLALTGSSKIKTSDLRELAAKRLGA
jgi:fatty-acyl-CoA synthase